MSKALILSILFIVSLASMPGISQYGGLIVSFPPSSITNGMGGSPVGPVNIWHQNALCGYENPAIPSLHQGEGFGFTSYQWLPGSGLGDMYYNATLLNVSHYGVALLLPGPVSPLGRFGTVLDLGEQVFTDENNKRLLRNTKVSSFPGSTL